MTNDVKPSVAVLMTCFNRCDQTLLALEALAGAVGKAAQLIVVLVDDGSTDGTADRVRRNYPDVHVVTGSGNLFWNGGMRLAWQSALPFEPSFFLWLNDDTVLRAGAISDLLKLYINQPDARTIIVGCTVDPDTAEVSYGGYRRISGSFSRLRFRHLNTEEAECDAMNGNCVLIPAQAVKEVGINSPEFRHAYGDIDYGLRARLSGWKIVELKDPVATQRHNSAYSDSVRILNFRNWRYILFHPKGVALREWWAFCRYHGGNFWFLNFAFRYLKMAFAGMRPR